jgi:hypothetical protein
VAHPVDGGPVVEAGALQAAVVEAEPEPADEVEAGAGGGAEARHVAGVRRDFGLPEGDVQHAGGSGRAGSGCCTGGAARAL